MSLECYLALLVALERARKTPAYSHQKEGLLAAIEAVLSPLTTADKARLRALVIGSGNQHLLDWSC